MSKRHGTRPRLPTMKRCQQCVRFCVDCPWDPKDELCRHFRSKEMLARILAITTRGE